MNWIRSKYFDYLQTKALRFCETEQYDKAIKIYQKLKSSYPNWAPPIANEGLCHFHNGNFNQANELIDYAIQLESDNLGYQYIKLAILVKENKFEDALAISSRLVADGGNNEGYLAYHGLILYSLKQHQESINIYEKLYHITEKIDYKMCIGDNLSKQNKIAETISIYEEVIKIDPNNYSAMNNLGYAKLKIKKYDVAKSYFDKALALKNDFAFAYNNRGFANLKLSKFHEAKLDIEQSITLDAKNAYAYKNQALYFIAVNQKDKALEALLLAKRLNFKDDYGSEVDELITTLENNSIN